MTIYQNPRKALLINPQYTYTGRPFSSASLGAPLQQTFNNLRNWRSGEFVAHYFGRPDETVHGDGSNGTMSHYYIITGFPLKEDTTNPDRDLIAIVQNWEKGYTISPTPVNEAFKWYKLKGGSLTQTLFDDLAHGTGVTNDSNAVQPSGRLHKFGGPDNPMKVTPTASNDGFQCSDLTSDYALVASLTVFAAPPENSLTAAQNLVHLGNMYPGQSLRGYDSDEGDSIGAICHLTDTGDSVIHNTRRCMFQTPYPVAATASNTTSWTDIRQDSSGNGYTYRVRPRNLTGGTSLVDCDVAIVITADSGAKVRLYDATSGEYWEYTSGGDTAALVTTSSGTSSRAGSGYSGMPVTAGAYSYISVQTLTGSSKDVDIHTVSLWDPSSGR